MTARWSRLQEGLHQLHARIESIDTMQQGMAAQLALTSKSLDQAARDQQVMEQQLEMIGQTVAGLTSSHRSRKRDRLERSAPNHKSRASSWETAVPRRSGLQESGVLFPSAASMPTKCSTFCVKGGGEEIVREDGFNLLQPDSTIYSAQVFVGMPQVSANQELNGIPRVDELSYCNYGEQGEATPWLQKSPVARAASEPVWSEGYFDCKETNWVSAQVINKVFTHVDGSSLFLEIGVVDAGLEFDERTHKAVVWDEESERIDESYDLPCLAHGDCMVTVKSCTDDMFTEESGAMTEMFNIMPAEDTATAQPKSRLAFLASQEHAKETVDEIISHEMVWNEEVLSDVNTHESLLQKLAMGAEDLTDEKVKFCVKIVDAGQVFEEMSEKDDQLPFGLDVQDGLLQQLAFGGECMDDQNTKPIVMRDDAKMLELKVVGGDNSNGNLQLGEHEADAGMVLPSTESGCGADHFSPQCPNQRGKDNLFLVLYEACVGQDMNCDRQNLVIFEERQEQGSAQYVVAEISSWRLNAFSTLNCDIEVAQLVFDKIHSWRRSGFSPGSYELKRTLSDIFNKQLSDQAFKSELFVAACLLDVEYQGCISVWQWDPGICSYLIMGLSLRISEISVLIQFIQKSSEIFSLQLLTYTCWLLEEMLAEISNAKVSTLAHGEIDNVLFLPGGFNTAGIEHPELCKNIMIQCLPRILKFGKCSIFEESSVVKLKCLLDVVFALHFLLICSDILQHKVASSVRRQWDPGIMQVHVRQWIGWEYKCCTGSCSWTGCYDVVWKELLNTATAWGQAVFCGGGNVMTQEKPKTVKAHLPITAQVKTKAKTT